MRKRVIIATVWLALACHGNAGAGFIQYNESITTDVTLGGTAYANRLVTLSFTADTSNVVFVGGNQNEYTNLPTSATVTIAGVGTATFSDSFQVGVETFPTFSEFSATDLSSNVDILDNFAVASGFAGYDLKSAFGPTTGGASYFVGTTFATNLGNFAFTKAGGGVTTFTASVPEPSSFVLAALGIAGAIACHARRPADRAVPLVLGGRLVLAGEGRPSGASRSCDLRSGARARALG